MRYAEVAVHAPVSRRLTPREGHPPPGKALAASSPLGGTYHYVIPDSLSGAVVPGSLVSVPFGERTLQGIVVALSDSSPVADTKDIAGLVRREPVLTPVQLALVRWLSERYLAPLIDAIRLCLPPGLIPAAEPVLDLLSQPPWPDDLSAVQRALLERLRAGPARWRRLRRQHPEFNKPSVLKPLLARGLIRRQRLVVETPARPKTGKTVRLLADDTAIARALPRLGHASKQADALAWLASTDDPLPTLAAVCAGAGCGEGPVRGLAARGWVEITPRRELVSLALPPRQVDELVAGELARSAAQARALTLLRDAASPLDAADLVQRAGVSPATLRALETRGYIRRLVDEPQVILTLERGAVPDRIVELRGSEKQRAVLEALQRNDGLAWIGWVYAETGATLETLRDLEAAGLIHLDLEEAQRDPLAGRTFAPDKPPVLTADQTRVWAEIEKAINGRATEVFLLHGVTGSGKTEIYLRALAKTLAEGKQGLVLVPEIALTPQTVQRFASRFPGQVTLLHSGLSAGERFDQWRKIRAGEANIVVGSRLALFAPLPRLGLIVMDEEHEPAYKQEQSPRYHAREAAIELGRLTGSPVILGSATPTLESYHRARHGEFRLLQLPQRILGSGGRQPSRSLPPVQIVDMRQELRAGNSHIFSRALQSALRQVLAAGEQAILFLNRRGAAPFVLCRDCGYVVSCPRCDVPLTYHEPESHVPVASLPSPSQTTKRPAHEGEGQDGGEGSITPSPHPSLSPLGRGSLPPSSEIGREAFRSRERGEGGEGRRSPTLLCHHCGRRYPVPTTCPRCGSHRIRYFGAGTQRVEAAVHELFPQARTLRWDRDVTGPRGMHEAILDRFIRREADVLIGTQMLAKGLDLPLVTLVGVVAADTALYLPDFRASERTFQLLTQIAGRAGRTSRGGRAIVQTYTPDAYAIRAAARHDYAGFYAREETFRREQGYPPFRRLAKLVFVGTNELTCRREADRLARALREHLNRAGEPLAALIGPAPCFFRRLRGRYRWQIVVRAADPVALLRHFPLPRGWRVDVDPISLL
ncbi:MAG: primosomal protein N' [Anaerolineae bacterium]|nr:primosomal protein N' [Anaerolineae bacterium]